MHGTDVAKFDVAIIGAGLHGISMARFWLDTHPKDNLLIIERDAGVGGVWSHERTFDNFWLQSPEQLDFFSDVSLELPENIKMVWGTFPSKYISEYLEAYIDRPIYDNRSLRSRTWFKSEVSRLSKEGSVWRIDFADSSLRPSVLASKIAIATGLTSQPNLPGFIKEPDFGIPFVHHRDFGRKCKRILAGDSPYKTITVIGGGKSSVDLIVAALDAGTKDVNWIIRTSGEGPGLFVWPESKRYNNSGNYVMTQTGTSMGVSGWGDPGLEPKPKTQDEAAESRKMIEKRIEMRDQICSDFARYHGRPDALPCFADLAPDANGSFFWQTAPCGSIQREDFWDKVSKKVQVYRGDIVGHTSDSLVLQDGRSVPTDFLLCGTGWSAEYPFISSNLAHKLGLPHDTAAESAEEAEQWAKLSQEADESIFERHPILKDGPAKPSTCPARQRRTPVRLYKAMMPLTDQSIVFLGRCKVLTNYILAEAQAMWATALWDGNVPFPEADEAKRAVAYMNRFSRWRYPNRGGDGVSFQLDQLWYIDNILREAGLSSHRKAWWTDKEEPIVSADLADCKDEYLAKHAKPKMVQVR